MKSVVISHLPYFADPAHYFAKIRGMPCPVLLDSGHSDSFQTWGRYSILSADPDALLTLAKGHLTLEQNGQVTILDSRQLAHHQQALLDELGTVTDSDLPFTGGLIGFWGYELGVTLEAGRFNRSHALPDLKLGRYRWAVIIDHHEQNCRLVAHPSLPSEQLENVKQLLHSPASKLHGNFQLKNKFQSNLSRAEYGQAFDRIKEYINAGDCYQINLTQRFSSQYQGDPWAAYCHLRRVSPTPFAAFLDFPQLQVLSLSPEQFLGCENDQVSTKPIKGTRPRGLTPEQDESLAQELCGSLKDQAENLMIVDLLRNDLGRSCRPGSVKVPILFGLESYPNVHHLVSTVTGCLAPETSHSELLLRAFPGGSITGAPKIRAMEIIEELEPTSRSVYCGSIGYLSCNQRMNTSIAIRTLVADGNTISCWGGGGIIADSECESEYQESITKVQNLLRGLENLALVQDAI